MFKSIPAAGAAVLAVGPVATVLAVPVDDQAAAAPEGEEVASWLICTHAFQRRYGLGISRPFPLPVSEFIRSGYLKTGNTVETRQKAAWACANTQPLQLNAKRCA